MIIVLDDKTRIHVVTPISLVERNNIQSVVFPVLCCSLSALVLWYCTCIVQFFYNANCHLVFALRTWTKLDWTRVELSLDWSKVSLISVPRPSGKE